MAVDADAAPERDVSGDGLGRYRAAATREVREQIADAFDRDARAFPSAALVGLRGTGEGSSCGLARRWMAPVTCAALMSPSPIAR